jgi:hypothetical protein
VPMGRSSGASEAGAIDDRHLGRPDGRPDFTHLRLLRRPYSNYVDLGVSMSLTGSGRDQRRRQNCQQWRELDYRPRLDDTGIDSKYSSRHPEYCKYGDR